MVKVILDGTTKKIKCINCYSLLEYSTKDFYGKGYGYITCPVCNHRIFIDGWKKYF